MDSSEDKFAVSGPMHMMEIGTGSSPTKMAAIDWDNQEHRRCIAACLTKGIYVMENDRSKIRLRQRAHELAPAWWESFHFQLFDKLEHPCKCICCKMSGDGTRFIYGAVFKYSPPGGAPPHPSAPSFIVAFRGTMPRDPTSFGDMGLNLRVLFNRQHSSSRFRNARELVEQLLDSNPNRVVWLAGHSLGASMALDVGRYMMIKRKHNNLPAFLFNPPQVSLAPAASGMDEKAKRRLYGFSYSLKYGLGQTILWPLRRHMEVLFEWLSPWVPEIYVHDRDGICKGFIDYFVMREQMGEHLGPHVARSATMLSYRDGLIFSAVVGFGEKNKEQPHLLPSARLWLNSTADGNAHELRQWWQPKLMLTSKQYKWV